MSWTSTKLETVVAVNPKLEASDKPNPEDLVSFVPMASVSEVTQSIEIQTERRYEEVSKGFTPFKNGDVLIAKITPCFENGKMALVKAMPTTMGFGTTEFHVLRSSEKIIAEYLYQLMRNPYVKKAGTQKMKGAAGQRRVPKEFFSNLQIPLPPLELQQRFAAIVESVEQQKAAQRAHLEELDTLFACLQQRAFAGELVT